MISTLLFCPYALANAINPVNINYGAIPNTIEKDNILLINISLTNEGKEAIENLELDIVSTGFKDGNDRSFPSTIYPNTTIHKQYAIEALKTGKHEISANWQYVTKSSSVYNGTLGNQFSGVSKIKMVEIIEPIFKVDFSLLGQSVVPTLIGLITGSAITILVEKYKERDNEKKEKKKMKNRIKNIVIYQLDIYLNYLKENNWNYQPDFLNRLITEGIYYYLEENNSLKEEISDLNSKITQNPPVQTEERKKELINQIIRIRKTILEW